MKKSIVSYGLLIGLLLLAGCSKERFVPAPQPAQENVAIDYSAPVFNSAIETEHQSKTQIQEDGHLHWMSNDRVSLFCGSTANQQYVFSGRDGDRSGLLKKVAAPSQNGESASANYAVYPYDSNATLSDGILHVNLPQTQTYVKGSFGPGASTMVAVTRDVEDYNLNFRNVTGYLVVKLYGDMTVKQVSIQSYGGEKISGSASITASCSGAPSVTMSSDASDRIVLDCGSGVKLGETSETATEFWFALPPVTFSQGFTVNVTDTQGHTFSRARTASGTIARNRIVGINPFRVSNKAGEYVRMTSDPELYDSKKVKSMIEEAGISLSSSVVDILYDIINKNGDIMLNRVVYTTTDRFGNIVEASGIITYQVKMKNNGTAYSKITSVSHYTCNFEDAPSINRIPVEAAVAFKEGNQIVTLADYLGYGVSQTADNQHPYMVDNLSGTACADLVEAAEPFLSEVGLKKSGKGVTIDLIGYSQGGAAVISTLKVLEKRGKKIGSIIAGGGPYDMKEFFNSVIASAGKEIHHLGFIVFALKGIIYGENLNVDIHNILAPEMFSSGIYSRLQNSTVNSWNRLVGYDVKKVFHPDIFAEGYNGNADIIKLMSAVQKNSTLSYNGAYKSQIKLYASKSDDIVPYACSQNASKNWGCGLTNLELGTHDRAGVELYAKYLIDYFEHPLLKSLEWALIKGIIESNF